MYIYIFELVVIILLGYFSNKINFRNSNKFFIVVSFIIIIVVAGLRKYTVGIDLETQYAYTFTLIGKTDWNSVFMLRYEPGYIILCKLLYMISPEPQFYIFSTSLICFGSVGYFIYRYSENVCMSTFLFISLNLMFNYMNIIRQALALSIVMLGMNFLKNKKYIRFTIIVIIAASFHTSALIMLILIPLSIIKYKKYFLLLCTFIGVLFVAFGKYFFTMSSAILNKYDGYASQGNLGVGIINYYTIINSILVFLVFFIAHYSIIKIHKKRDRIDKINSYSESITINCNSESLKFSNDFIMYMLFLATIFQASAMSVGILARLRVYFQPFIYLAVPMIANRFFSDLKSKTMLKISIFIISIVYFAFTALHTSARNFGTIPYYFFWQ